MLRVLSTKHRKGNHWAVATRKKGSNSPLFIFPSTVRAAVSGGSVIFAIFPGKFRGTLAATFPDKTA